MYVCVYAESITTTSMSKRRNNNNKTTGRFEPSYQVLEQSQMNPYSGQTQERTASEIRKDPLSGYQAWPRGNEPANPVFVSMNKTLRAKADACIKEFEFNYKGVTLRRTPYTSPDNQRELEDMFSADPLGLVDVPKTNINCWQLRSVVTSSGTGATSAVTADGTKAGASAATESPPVSRGPEDRVRHAFRCLAPAATHRH